MGSHAGCTKGSCGGGGPGPVPTIPVRMQIVPARLLNLPDFVPCAKNKWDVPIIMSVGVNQIELADHGSQEYQFLPEIKEISHKFINISATYESSWGLKSSAQLHNEYGESTTRFEAVDRDQPGFFPSRWELSLFLKLDLHIPWVKYLGLRDNIQLVNKTPLYYRTDKPLTGFPPVFEPAFLLQQDVPFYVVGEEHLEPAIIFPEGHPITPDNVVRYTIETTEPKIEENGEFTFSAKIAAINIERNVRTTLALIPSRGVSVKGPELIDMTISPIRQHLEISGKIEDPDEAHLEVTLRPYSRDPNISGAARHDVHLPEKEKQDPFQIIEPRPKHILSHSDETIILEPLFDRTDSEIEFHWTAPHNIPLDNPNTFSPTFHAPVVKEPIDIWFTLFMRKGDKLSKPYKIEYIVEPA